MTTIEYVATFLIGIGASLEWGVGFGLLLSGVAMLVCQELTYYSTIKAKGILDT